MNPISPQEKKSLDNDPILGPIRKKFLLISQNAGKAAILFGSTANSTEAVESFNLVMKTANEIIDMVKETTDRIKARREIRERGIQ